MVVTCKNIIRRLPARYLILLAGLLILALAAPAPAWSAASRIKAVSAKSADADLTVTVIMTKPIKPKVFGMALKTDNPRLVIDFIGATAGRLPSKIVSPSPLARRVRIGKHRDKIRIVIDLTPGYRFTAQQWFDRQANRYRLVLSVPTH